jgi:GNAT superfamily N-acetyltransferase
VTADTDGLVRLTRAQVKPAAEIMGRAFEDYPLTAFFFPDKSARRKNQAKSFESLLRYGVLYGEVYATSPKLEGVAMWLPSGQIDRTLWRNFRCGKLALLIKAIWHKNPRQRANGEYSRAAHKRRAPFPHMYLQLLGVDPEHQGKGYSSLLLKAMFERTDKDGLPCFLETQAEKNVGIYKHLGFKVVEEGIVPGRNVTSWAMLQDAGVK